MSFSWNLKPEEVGAIKKEKAPMLVLSRKQNESLVIGEKILVEVIRIEMTKARLQFFADRAVKIYRKDVYDVILKEGRKAAEELRRPIDWAAIESFQSRDGGLVLTLGVGESVAIGLDIFITLVHHQGMSVRLGTKAPREISVHRYEVWEKNQTY